MADLIQNNERLREIRAKLNATLNPYETRAAFEAAQVPAAVTLVHVINGGAVFQLVRNTSGDWQDGAGDKWQARLLATPEEVEAIRAATQTLKEETEALRDQAQTAAVAAATDAAAAAVPAAVTAAVAAVGAELDGKVAAAETAQSGAAGSASTATTQAGVATTKASEAATARDAAIAAAATAGTYDTAAAGVAAVAEGAKFWARTADGQSIQQYTKTGGAAVAVAGNALSTDAAFQLVRGETVVEPFPVAEFDLPVLLGNTGNPSSGLTVTAGNYSIAAGGRFYAVPTIASLGLAIGDTVRVAFRRLAGSVQPSAITFRAGTTLVSTVDFRLIGGWWIAEAVIPATTTIIRIDFSNASGSAVVITRPAFSKPLAARAALGDAKRRRLDGLTSDPGVKANLWRSAGVTVASLGGAGSVGAVVVSADTVALPADINAQIRAPDFGIMRDNGQTLTVAARVGSAALVGTGVQARFVGISVGTQVVPMRPVGDGWWLGTAVIASGDAVGIRNVYVEVDNRQASNPAWVGFDSAPVTVGPIIVVDGTELPAALPAAAADTYPDDEIVITQTAGALAVAHRAGEVAQYARWTLSRYDDAATRALGWRINALETVTRIGDTAFAVGTAITDLGELEVAIKEVGKSDFMGGSTHGDMQETRDLILIIDGRRITPDGATSYRARRVEAIQRSQMLEADNASPVVTATLVTHWIWERGALRLQHRLEWARNLTITTPYLSMLAVLRGTAGAISGAAYAAPEFEPFDISAAGHGMPQGNYSRIMTTGSGGITCDVEIVKGWTSAGRSYAEDTATRNKLYFSPWSISGNTAVVAGDVVDWEAVYRIGVSA